MKTIILTFLTLALLAGVAATAPVWDTVVTMEDGIPSIMNPATPRDGETTVTAVEQWRMGADEENDPLFGRLRDVVTDAEGNAYLLDGNMSTIHVISPEGAVLRTIGREGDGPGEFRNSTELAFMPGGFIGVLEMMPGKVVCLDFAGDPQPTFRPDVGGEGAMLLPQHIDSDGTTVVFGYVSAVMGGESPGTNYVLSRYQADGSTVGVLLERHVPQSGNGMSISIRSDDNDFTGSWSLADDGRVVVYRRPFEYKLEIFDENGEPAMIIGREFETRRRPEAELESARQQAEEMNQRFPGMEQVVEERARDISAVHARPGGELWVATSEGVQAGSLGVFDVFDGEGRFVHNLRINGVEFASGRDEYVLDGDRLYVFREALMAPARTSTSGGGGMQVMMVSGGGGSADDDEESGPMEVVCYRLEE